MSDDNYYTFPELSEAEDDLLDDYSRWLNDAIDSPVNVNVALQAYVGALIQIIKCSDDPKRHAEGVADFLRELAPKLKSDAEDFRKHGFIV